MMEQVLSLLAELAVGAVALVVAYYLVPWLKEKRLYSIVKKAVEAAEKLSEREKLDKKEYVRRILASAGVHLCDAVDAVIEGCVLELDLQSSDSLAEKE
ncbi:MAG: hypothetical protein IJN63_09520 [Clostridia bacterium]|nr:hypothetical protein [Clostridia bacterium]